MKETVHGRLDSANSEPDEVKEDHRMQNITSNNNASFIEHVDMLPVLLPAITIGVGISSLNVFTVCIILISKRLRRPANYPLVSVLLGAALQGLLTAPTYVYKRLDEQKHVEYWLCDFYRFPYFLCGHILKISLMLVSFDRLIATKDPYRYPYVVTKKIVTIILSSAWLVVILADMIPFLPFGKLPDREGCTYTPKQAWGIGVIVSFNIIPFIVIFINYIVIWRLAIKISFKEYHVKESLHLSMLESKTARRRDTDDDSKRPLSDDKLVTNSENDDDSRVTNDMTCSLLLGKCKPKCIDQENNELQSHDKMVSQDSQVLNTESQKKNKKHLWEKASSKKLRLAWELKATKTSLILFSVYILCWGPLGMLYMIDHFCKNCISGSSLRSSDRFIVKIVSFLSSFFLPIVYCWRTKEFRMEACRLTWKKRWRKNTSEKMFRNSLLKKRNKNSK